MNKVVHFEIPFDDKERAKKFYAQTFDWTIDEMPEIGYIGLTTTPADAMGVPTEPGAINGGMTERTHETPAPVITIGVDSIEESVKKIEASGGKVITPKGKVPGMGYFIYFQDTEGNVIGLWQDL